MAAVNGSKRPKNTRQAVRRLLHYMGYHKFLLALVAVWSASAAARISWGHTCSTR